MANISVQDLQDIAVSCTSDFYNHGTPLSVGLAKQASDRGLNSEQIKRAIEATNTLAYLKSVDGNDRTGEFPLADYNEILKCASMPEDMTVHEKTASAPASVEEMTKQAEFEKFEMPELTKQAAMKMLIKEASANKRALEDAQARAFHLTLDLEKAAHELARMPHALEGLSLASRDVQFTKLARLTFGTEKTPQRLDWVEDVKLHRDWKPAMQKAAALSDMLTLAQDTVAEIEHRSGLDKQAGLLTTLAAGVGRAARSVVSAPFKFVGNKVANGVNAGIDVGVTKAQKMMGNSSATLKPSTVKTLANSKKMWGAAGLAVGAGTDAAFYKPKNDPAHNAGGDVWDALN